MKLYLRTILGVLIVSAAIWVIVAEQMSGASADATINARLVTVRAPVAGTVQMPQRALGARISQGEALASLRDPLVDSVRLDDLIMERAIAAAEVTRLSALATQTRDSIGHLATRRDIFSQERVSELETRLSFARERLEIIESGELHEGALDGIAGALEEDSLRQPLEPNLPELWVNYARERVATLEIELRSAEAGVFLGDGYNDAPFSEQRLTELQHQLQTHEAGLAEAETALAAITAREATERLRVNRFGGANLVATVNGVFWEVLASDGETLQRGDAVARLLDCDSTLVTLSVTEAVFNRLSTGDAARFRPRGQRDVFDATVERLAGVGAGTVYQNLAVAPDQRHLERFDVSLSVPGLRSDPDLSCAIGRTGRVFFDARPLDRLRAFLRSST